MSESPQNFPIDPSSYTQKKVREKDGWEQLWKENKIGWDKGLASPAFIDLLQKEKARLPPPLAKALVPGCGSGYDVFEFAKAGYQAYGIDLSETAIQQIIKNPYPSSCSFIACDFFNFEFKMTFDLAYDYTFFCAIFPDQRQQWADTYARLINPGGVLITLMFPIGDHVHGPPFAVQPEHYHKVLDSFFDLELIEEPTNSHSDRQGREKIAIWRRK